MVLFALSSAVIWAVPTETPAPADTPQAGETVSTSLSKEGSDAAARGDYASALKAFQKAADQGDAASDIDEERRMVFFIILFVR